MPAREETLARLITEARLGRRALEADADEWRHLTPEEAERVAELLYRQWGAEGSRFWKLGAIDEATQARLGVTAPICAPLVPAEVVTDCYDVHLDSSQFIRAKMEPEIGIRVIDGALRAMPCVEVADSRFSDWRLPPGGVIADAALQGSMLFGHEAEADEVVTVRVSLDGEVLGEGEAAWAEAVERLQVLPPGAGASHVATGAMTRLFDVRPGVWEFDFGSLGLLRVSVS